MGERWEGRGSYFEEDRGSRSVAVEMEVRECRAWDGRHAEGTGGSGRSLVFVATGMVVGVGRREVESGWWVGRSREWGGWCGTGIHEHDEGVEEGELGLIGITSSCRA